VLERSIFVDELLQPLAEEFGALAVWHASVEVLGYPPWLLGTQELLSISSFLNSKGET
jgi:hypothetical protein